MIFHLESIVFDFLSIPSALSESVNILKEVFFSYFENKTVFKQKRKQTIRLIFFLFTFFDNNDIHFQILHKRSIKFQFNLFAYIYTFIRKDIHKH